MLSLIRVECMQVKSAGVGLMTLPSSPPITKSATNDFRDVSNNEFRD